MSNHDVKCLFGFHAWQKSSKFPTMQEDFVLKTIDECSNCGLLKKRCEPVAVYAMTTPGSFSPGGIFGGLQVNGKEVLPKEYKKIEKRLQKRIGRDYTYPDPIPADFDILHPWPPKVKKLGKWATRIWHAACINFGLMLITGMIFDNHTVAWSHSGIGMSLLSLQIITVIKYYKIKKKFRRSIINN